MSAIPESVRSALDGLRSLGGDALVAQMVAVFIEYSGDRIRILQQAVDASDFVAAAEAAHALKGSSRQLGLAALADACLAVELAAKGSDAAAAKSLAPALHETFAAAAEWLTAATA